MLERVLELFFHAKSGVFAGIFLLGTTGALVTATVSNGVATITITTQASASPSASASANASPSPTAVATASPSPTMSATASPSPSPSSSASSSANPCSAQAHEMADAVKTVNSAFSGFHTDLMHMRTDAKSAKDTIENADKLLKSIRQNAVKAIHATSTCASGKDDEDNDNEQDEDDDDNDEHGSARNGNFVAVLFTNLQSLFGNHTVTVQTTTASASPAPSGTIVTGSDPKTIADNAVAAMQVVFDDAKTTLDALPTPSPRATRSPKGTAKADVKAKSEHGHGSSDREGDDD